MRSCYNKVMDAKSKSRILGAFVVGFAIVALTYTINSLSRPMTIPSNVQSAAATKAPMRVFVETQDKDNNGLEDWQEEFVKSSPIIISSSSDDYVLPDTLTGQVGINFFQGFVSSKAAEGMGRSKEQVIADTIESVKPYGSDKIFTVSDITISKDSSPEALRTYANAAAEAIMVNSVPGIENELLLLREVLSTQDAGKLEDLKTLAKVYRGTFNDTLKIPVPQKLAKEHLDLINVYNALANDIDAMTKSTEDPMLSLVRIKRYSQDVEGLSLALKNLYTSLEPYASVFNKDDSALLFVTFNPDFQ